MYERKVQYITGCPPFWGQREQGRGKLTDSHTTEKYIFINPRAHREEFYILDVWSKGNKITRQKGLLFRKEKDAFFVIYDTNKIADKTRNE